MKKTIGIIIDILMYGILTAQLLYVFMGNAAHEILGIAFFVCLVCHVIIKRSFFRALTKFGSKPPVRRVFDAVTLLLMLCVIVLMLSSMGVSRLIFPWFRALGSAKLHHYLASAVFTLAVVHGTMHGYMHAKKKKRAAVLTVIAGIAAAATALFLVPYLNRHFRVVDIVYAEAVEGERLAYNGKKPLVVYFTRIGNTNFETDVDAVSGASLLLADGELMGNTELLADMIDDMLECDVRAVTLTGEKYPSSYGDTVSVAGKELRQDARPDIEDIDITGYDSVILVYPLWWGTVPMPVATFLESGDWSGKELYLIATQGSSGFASSTNDIKSMARGAAVTELASIYCDDIPTARDELLRCLKGVFE